MGLNLYRGFESLRLRQFGFNPKQAVAVIAFGNRRFHILALPATTRWRAFIHKENLCVIMKLY